MKWKVELLTQLVITSQLLLLFFSWWLTWLTNEESYIVISSIWLVLGVLGGIAMTYQKPLKHEQNKKLQVAIRVMGAFISTILIFLLFIPLFSIILYSKLTAVLIVLGWLSPIVIYKSYNRRETINA